MRPSISWPQVQQLFHPARTMSAVSQHRFASPTVTANRAQALSVLCVLFDSARAKRIRAKPEPTFL